MQVVENRCLAAGFLRPGELYVRIYSYAPLRLEDINIHAELADSSIISLAVEPSGDFELGDLVERKALSLISEYGFQLDVRAPLPDEELEGIAVYSMSVTPLSWAYNFSLQKLRTVDLRSFNEVFTFKSQRHADPQTVSFIAQQNLNVVAASPAIHLNSAVIYTYKALELHSPELWRCSTLLDDAEQKIKLFNAVENSGAAAVRSNPISAQLSVNMVRTHLYLYTGQNEKIYDLCNRTIDFIEKVPFSPIYAFNYTKILMAGAITASFAGGGYDKRKKIYLDHVINAFYRSVSVRLPDRYVDPFDELKYSHEMASIAMRLLKENKNPTSMAWKIVPAVVRIKDQTFCDTIVSHLRTYRRRLRLPSTQ